VKNTFFESEYLVQIVEKRKENTLKKEKKTH